MLSLVSKRDNGSLPLALTYARSRLASAVIGLFL